MINFSRKILFLVLFMVLIPVFSSAAPIATKNTDKYGKPLPTNTEEARRQSFAAMEAKKNNGVVQVTADPIANGTVANPGGTSAVVDDRPQNVAPDRNRMCPTGYWCRADHSGFLPTCVLGSAPPHENPQTALFSIEALANAFIMFNDTRDCNQVAGFCRILASNALPADRGPIYDAYCKD